MRDTDRDTTTIAPREPGRIWNMDLMYVARQVTVIAPGHF